MLPLQITLEGFLSYGEKTTISFEGASLWMLAGANGAGKSSVFDAMRWTLFGAHRGGKSGQEALIHRGKNRLRVAFDLQLGEARFRLMRTLARAGRSTWQIEELRDKEWIKVPETDSREGYEKWVRENIGIGDETFCTAMYLAQNRGDAILGASPVQRYEMLAEIVDISAYAALHEQAKTRASELEIAARAAEKAWQNAPVADELETAAFTEKLEELTAQIAQNQTRREQLLGLEPLATQWTKWETERLETQKMLHATRFLLQDAPQIERDWARLGELEGVLPLLTRYVEARTRATKNRGEIAQAEIALKSAHADLTNWQTQSASLNRDLAKHESARQNAEAARLAAVSQAAELAPRLFLARQIADFEWEITALEEELSAFPVDLAAQENDLQTRMRRAEEQRDAGAVWRRFLRDKALYQKARAREREAKNAAEVAQNALVDAQKVVRQCVELLEAARENETRAVEILAAAGARCSDAQSALARFESVQDQSNCFFCGQTLTFEHAQKEKMRLQAEGESAKNDEETARSALETAHQSAKDARQGFDRAQKQLRHFENSLESASREQQDAQSSADQARIGAESTFDELAPQWQTHFGGESQSADTVSTRVRRLLGNEHLDALQQDECESLEKWRLELQNVVQERQKRERVTLRLDDRRAQLAMLSEKAPRETLEMLLEQESELTRALDAAQKSLQIGEETLGRAREAALHGQQQLEAARERSAKIGTQLAVLLASQTEIERAVEQSAAPPLAAFFASDENTLLQQFAEVENEKMELEGRNISVLWTRLQEAQRRVAGLEADIARLEGALGSVPPDARRAPAGLRLEVSSLKNALESDGVTQRELQQEKSRLEERRDEKARLETVHLELQNHARQHKTLADLLGPNELQRFLVREAENGIIDEANATLDRISGGQLRLELRADDEEIAGARKGPPKVLDVAIFRADEADGGRGQGMLPAFLSGSQRFRVAVALALGIGRYATRGGGTRLEAVIIDEGFGALDKIGRGEMIDELQMLGEELRRVILVSHQEEFFEAFPNRYLIENDGQTSTARLMVS